MLRLPRLSDEIKYKYLFEKIDEDAALHAVQDLFLLQCNNRPYFLSWGAIHWSKSAIHGAFFVLKCTTVFGFQNLVSPQLFICDVIKQNESELANIEFPLYFIVLGITQVAISIFGTICLIVMGLNCDGVFSFKVWAYNENENWVFIFFEFGLILLDRITYYVTLHNCGGFTWLLCNLYGVA